MLLIIQFLLPDDIVQYSGECEDPGGWKLNCQDCAQH